MKKDKLVNFVSKYNLNGLCSQVKVTSKDNKLMTSFATEQKDLLGFVMVNGIDIKSTRDTTLGSDFEFGIFNTGTMTKILSVMQSDIDVTFKEESGKIVSVEFQDSVMTSRVMLADLDIIEVPPTINELPPVDIKLEINSVIIDQFIKAKNALGDSEVMAFVQDGDGVNLIINYAEHNTDNITLKMIVNEMSGDIPPMKFNANIIKEVLSSNKDNLAGSIHLSSQGLLTMTFSGDGFNTKYLIVMLQN